MTDLEAEKAWLAAEKSAVAARFGLLRETRDELLDLLAHAQKNVVAILASAPSEYQMWRLTQLQKEIERVMAELSVQSATVMRDAATSAWEGGKAAIDAPMAASGLAGQIGALPKLATEQVIAMRAFTVERIQDISVQAAAGIKRELGLAVIGSQDIHQTIAAVGRHLGPGAASRATTIVRTGLGQVWESGSAARAKQTIAAGVAMDKIWRRSGKVHSRLTHDLADGQRVPVEEPFHVSGITMMHPHDPAAPAKEIINCGCIALYRPRSWTPTLPDKRPFTAEELSANPFKADISALRTKVLAK